MTRLIPCGIALPATLALLAGCDSPSDPADVESAVSVAAVKLAPDVCAFGQSFTLSVTNPYYPLTPGSWWLLEGAEDDTPLRVRIDVTSETEIVGGVTTRVLTETEWEYDEDAAEWELVEVSHNYFAMTPAGDVCYFGEAVDDYEDGEIVSHEGEWRADEAGFSPGLFMPVAPRPGMKYRMEGAPGIAEDEGKIVGSGPVTIGDREFRETVRLREYNPLDHEKGYKVFAAGVGTVIDAPLSLVEYQVQ